MTKPKQPRFISPTVPPAGQGGSAPARLRLRITATAETIVRGGHPWLFADSVKEQNRAAETGELAIIYDRQDKFLAVGLYDGESPIRVRLLHAGKPTTVDRAWWRARLADAVARRAGLFDAGTTGYRLVNGESDGWPGLVLDRYADTLVLKLYSGVWLPRLNELRELLAEVVGSERLVLRLSRNIQERARERFHLTEGQVLSGSTTGEGVVFCETGLRLEADVLRGQKTGFFLDQRENRRRVEGLAAGRAVLNAFSFSGGFSLYAARGGARQVTDLDISAHALAAGDRNFQLNAGNAAVAGCPREAIQADVFEWLAAGATPAFDLVILDPPSLAKRETERAGAVQAYEKLTALGLRRLRPGGTLVSASCSAHVSAEEFYGAVRRAVVRSGRAVTELFTAGHAPDHPATFPEAQYLKAIGLNCS